jgi:D-cysteine desulfhydrase
LLENIARRHLAELPTPLHEAPRLANKIGLSRLYIKRDDLTGLAMGGNKARKLEYEFAEALKKECDVVITVGGIQSNHTRMTAAAARKSGIEAKIILGGPDFTEIQGNLLLQVLLGTEIRLVDNDSLESLSAAQDNWVQELTEQGRKPYLIPIGGSTGLGALGYVNAMLELAEQFGKEPVQIVLAVGSCGTLAGTILGARIFMPGARIIGISVSRSSVEITSRTKEIIEESCRILKMDENISESAVESYDTYYEEYGKVTESGKEAILLSARTEGLLLDPVYTGKAMAGLIGLVKNQVIDPSIATIFIHTGGTPGLFAYEKYFRDLTWRTRRS